MRSFDRDRFSASITKCSLKLQETRVLAGLLMSGTPPAVVIDTVISQNLLQKRASSTSRTFCSYLMRRLEQCPPCIHKSIAQGLHREASQAVFIAALAESAILRAFCEHSLTEITSSGRAFVTGSDWMSFRDWLETQDPKTASWTPVVWSKMRQNIWRILDEVDLVDSTNMMSLQPMRLEPPISACLEDPSLSHILPALRAIGAR